jgi:hypothetical protein
VTLSSGTQGSHVEPRAIITHHFVRFVRCNHFLRFPLTILSPCQRPTNQHSADANGSCISIHMAYDLAENLVPQYFFRHRCEALHTSSHTT